MTTAIIIITSNNKTPQSLNLRHLVFPAPENSSQLTQGGGAKVRQSCHQLLWEGPVLNYINLTGISEQPDLRKGFLKTTTGWIFIIIGWMCTHTSNTTHIYVQTTCKVNLASNDIFQFLLFSMHSYLFYFYLF